MQPVDSKALSQFYTRPDLARKYVEDVCIRWDCPDIVFIEPSGGAGAFIDPLLERGRKVRSMDILPKHELIREGDFLEPHSLFPDDGSPVIGIGNPPFGKNSSMAVKFFNELANHADAIALIVPRTFRKMSLQERLHPNFHLIADEDVPKNAFIFQGKPHDVPCAWQIWERRVVRRESTEIPCVDHLISYVKPEEADFAMRRVGYYAGTVKIENLVDLSRSSHYFMKENRRGAMDVLAGMDWKGIVTQTAGTRSLSKKEIALMLANEMGKEE